VLASADYRGIVPYLRGYVTTSFLSNETFRSVSGCEGYRAVEDAEERSVRGLLPGVHSSPRVSQTRFPERRIDQAFWPATQGAENVPCGFACPRFDQ
jgi:hypothetical protein